MTIALIGMLLTGCVRTEIEKANFVCEKAIKDESICNNELVHIYKQFCTPKGYDYVCGCGSRNLGFIGKDFTFLDGEIYTIGKDTHPCDIGLAFD